MRLSNNSMQRTALRAAAAEPERWHALCKIFGA